jgi:hypothetical protein
MIYDDDCGAIGGMKIGRGNRSTRRKPSPVPLCPSQIPHDLTRARTQAAVLGSWRLTAWAMARPNKMVTGAHTKVYIKKGRKHNFIYVNYYKYGDGVKLWHYDRQTGREPLTAGTRSTVFWVITPCSLKKTRRFGGTYSFHLQGRII